jgi:L-asparagine transporter-like permease
MKIAAIIIMIILGLFAYVSCIVANNTDNKIERMNREKEKKK